MLGSDVYNVLLGSHPSWVGEWEGRRPPWRSLDSLKKKIKVYRELFYYSKIQKFSSLLQIDLKFNGIKKSEKSICENYSTSHFTSQSSIFS